MRQIDTGITSSVWATDANKFIYYLNGNTFEKVEGKLTHVSSGAAGVWGVNVHNHIFYREGTTAIPKGTTWKQVQGSLMQIDSGPKGVVCGVNNQFKIYCRIGITDAAPMGASWERISGELKYISCGAYGYWGVSRTNRIFFTPTLNGANTKWAQISGDLVQIEAGPNGQVWGVNSNNMLYTRIGVSKSSPSGLEWKKIGTRSFVSVTVGLDKLYAIDVGYTVFIGTIIRQTSPGLFMVKVFLSVD